jgi:hypothetical protein
MPRILRNYLLSFALIGLFFLVVHGINRCVESQMEPPPGPPSEQPAGQAEGRASG